MPPFHPDDVRAFRFLAYDYAEDDGIARLRYAFDDSIEFCEEIVFTGPREPLDGARRAALDRCLFYLHLAAGVSYYKAAVPPEIRVETRPISKAAARFFDRLYLHGLGEFAYRNQLDLRERIRFPAAEMAAQPPARALLPRRTAVPVGGGKDSVVTIEALRAAGEPMVLFSVGDYLPIREISEIAGIPRLVVERRISPALLELNQRGAWNGHVPISAIIAFILAAAAVVYGFDAAALSNERSASVPNLFWNGIDVNHQYSKSLEFERDFDALVEREVLPGFRYFSFLRPLSELAITAIFSRHRRYHRAFRSCNTAFRLDELRRGRRWCGDCPKCRFVFLALAPFLPKDELVAIFGGDLLDDPAQEDGFAELLGLGEHRPFECVGELDESVAALSLIRERPEWRDDVLVRRFAGVAAGEDLVRRVLAPAAADSVPERFRPMLPSLPEPG